MSPNIRKGFLKFMAIKSGLYPKAVITFLGVLLHILLIGQDSDPVFRAFTTEDGLPSNEVYQIIEDKRGYIWMATNKGVSRFDGYSFEKFNTENGLGDNSILGIFADKMNNIWCRSIAGKISVINSEGVKTLPQTFDVYFPNSIHADSLGRITVGAQSTGAIGTIDPPYSAKQFAYTRDTTCNILLQLFDDGYVFSRSGLGNTIKIKKGDRYLTIPLPLEENSPKTNVYANHDTTFLTSGNSLYRISPRGDLKTIELAYDIISCTIDKHNNLWVCLNNEFGVLMFDNCNLDSPPRHLFKTINITSVLEDFEGGYWFSTRNKGVLYVRSLESIEISIPAIFKGNDVRIFQNENEIVVCNHEGHFAHFAEGLLVNESNLLEHPNSAPGWIKVIKRNCPSSHYSDAGIYSHQGDTDFHAITSDQHLIPSPDRGFITGASTLFCYKADKKQLCIRESYKAPSRINASYPYGDSLLLACVDGLWYLKDLTVKRLLPESVLPQVRFDDVAVDDSGNIWIASAGNGIFLIRGNVVKQLTRKDGLPSDICNKILLQHSSCIVACDEGIAIVDYGNPDNMRIQTMTYQNGLPCRIVNDIAQTRDFIFILADNRFIRLPNIINGKHVQPPKIHIKLIEVNNTTTTLDQLKDLQYWQNNISFKLTALSYINPAANQFKYKLVGIDTAWHIFSSPEINFPSLPPGDYLFQAQSINSIGDTSTDLLSIPFRIAKPFWQSWWFISILILLLIAILVLVVQARTNSFRKKIEEREQIKSKIAEIEIRALRAQMNPHFIFNCINSIQHYVLDNNPLHANKLLAKFARLVRNVLELSNQQWVSIGKEIETLNLYVEMESMRFDSRFVYHLDIDPKMDLTLDCIPPLLIQPFVENAIVHGLLPLKNRPGKILIKLMKSEDVIVCTIEDNGIGRKRAQEISRNKRKTQEHTSLGLSLTEERLNIYNASGRHQRNIELHIIDLQDRNGEPEGTRIELTLPILSSK